MAKKAMQWLKKAVGAAAKNLKALAAGASPADFTMQDDGSDVCSVALLDSANQPVAAPTTVSITATSDTPAVCTVGSINGMQYTETAVSAGTANITVVATDSAGSFPPITLTYTDTITTGGPTGLQISHGPVTVTS